MNSAKWTWTAIGYQILFSYVIALMIYQFGRVLVLGEAMTLWTYIAFACLVLMVYLLFRPDPKDRLAKTAMKAAGENR